MSSKDQNRTASKMMEINELMMEREALKSKGIDELTDVELDTYYKVSDRIRELIGGDTDVQRKIEYGLERRFGGRFQS